MSKRRRIGVILDDGTVISKLPPSVPICACGTAMALRVWLVAQRIKASLPQ